MNMSELKSFTNSLQFLIKGSLLCCQLSWYHDFYSNDMVSFVATIYEVKSLVFKSYFLSMLNSLGNIYLSFLTFDSHHLFLSS